MEQEQPLRPGETPVRLAANNNANQCFFCGQANPAGLHLEFSRVDNHPSELVCRYTPDQHFSGQGALVHGGILGGILDEIMGWAVNLALRAPAVTSELKVEFLRPVAVGRPLEARARLVNVEGKKVTATAEITDEEGRVCTRGESLYIRVPKEHFDTVSGRKD